MSGEVVGLALRKNEFLPKASGREQESCIRRVSICKEKGVVSQDVSSCRDPIRSPGYA